MVGDIISVLECVSSGDEIHGIVGKLFGVTAPKFERQGAYKAPGEPAYAFVDKLYEISETSRRTDLGLFVKRYQRRWFTSWIPKADRDRVNKSLVCPHGAPCTQCRYDSSYRAYMINMEPYECPHRHNRENACVQLCKSCYHREIDQVSKQINRQQADYKADDPFGDSEDDMVKKKCSNCGGYH